MSAAPQPSRPFARPSFAPLQTTPNANNTGFQSYSSSSSSSSSSVDTPSPAPAPNSPSSHPPQAFFGSLNDQHQQWQQQQQQQQFQQQGQSLQRMNSYEYQPNREGAGQTAAETANFLNTSALLAEAAKRAQIACVMRDIEGMEL